MRNIGGCRNMKKSLACRLGFHKWLYRLPDWGGDGHTIRQDTSLCENHCPSCKCSWLQEGVMRICTRGCGVRHTYQRISDYLEWK